MIARPVPSARRGPGREPVPAARPVISFLTDGGVTSWGRIAEWLGRGFAELGMPYHRVFVGGPRGSSAEGPVTEVRLGVPRPRAWLPPLVRYLRRARPDLALAAPPYLIPFALTAGRLSGVPVVPWEASLLGHELELEDLNPRLRFVPFLERISYRWAPCAAVVSDDVGHHLIRDVLGRKDGRGPDLFLLPNPVDPEEVRRLATPPEPRGPGLRLCAVGRLVRSKGYDVLVEALALAGPRLEGPWELLILGEGSERPRLERLIRQRGLDGRVRLLGPVDNPYPVVASADLFVHPARWEPQGLAPLEALALGVCVIGTDGLGGARQVLDQGRFGAIVPAESPQALADAILRLAAHAEARAAFSRRGPERAAEYAPVAVARRVLELRDRVLAVDGGRD